MVNSSKTFGLSDCRVGTAHQSRLCHCERSVAISLHHSLFLVRHSIFTTTFAFLLVLFLIAAPAQAKYGGGTGEPNDPYRIATAEDLNDIGNHEEDWDKHLILVNDINLAGYTGTQFNVIGRYLGWEDPNNKSFTGVFDGNDKRIWNFTWSSTGQHRIGLFRHVGEGGEIKNLGIENVNFDAGTGGEFGGLVGYLEGGTIINCYCKGSVSGLCYVGALVGLNSEGTITNCYSTGRVSGQDNVGGLVGYNNGPIVSCYSTSEAEGEFTVGGLAGVSYDEIRNCYSTGSVSSLHYNAGGLVGYNTGSITDCLSIGSVDGEAAVGGLVGFNDDGTITKCYATGSVSGKYAVGGLVGESIEKGTITNCYATGSVEGYEAVGGLVGSFGEGMIVNCYSVGSISWTGEDYVGGLVGDKTAGNVIASFWDVETSGQSTSAGGTGLTTAEMQTMGTFTDVGWDFNTPIWTIDESVDYPRLWWETPVMHAEPEVTLGTSNTITWAPIPGANDYYAECAEDANFTSILYATGWITETSYKFTGLQLGQRYWYSVKARNVAGVESGWSNVESSLQVTLADAVDMMLDPESLKNKNMKNALLNKINAVLEMLDEGRYEEALNKLENDILAKMNGCAETGEPDKNDWIITCEGQSVVYPLVIETIEHIRGLMNQ